jgi:hypothetical protein
MELNRNLIKQVCDCGLPVKYYIMRWKQHGNTKDYKILEMINGWDNIF